MGSGPQYYNSIVWEVSYHKALGQLMVPVVRDCGHCGTASGNAGQAYVYRFNADGTMATNGVNPAPMGPVNAFDLRVGVCETSDGGFAAVSSTRPPEADHKHPTNSELGYLQNCPDLNTTDWDTDALIVKFNASGEKQWSKTFDVGDNRNRQSPPGDLKRQECMYKITQAQDGGYTISGNSSGNFDDFYMAKLYNECNAQQTYSWGPAYSIDILSNTTWNTSMNIVGKVVVHPGAILTVKGSGTTIRFADSKLAGIETNVTVMQGGLLKLEDGAIFTSIDTLTCKNSKWDGVKYAENPHQENSLIMYPNPTDGNFHLMYTGTEKEEVSFIITDLLGKELKKGKLASFLSLEITADTFSSGVYVVSLSQNKKVISTRKLVVVRP
jgi:hypothetical protein